MKILFLCMYMSGLHGSVVHILEYAKFFKSMNADISIGAVFVDPEIRKIAEREGFRLYRINNVPIDVEYDLVYALHLFLFPYLLLKGLAYKHSILGLLSVKGPIEQLPPSCMYPYFDLITAISPEIIAHYQDDFHIDQSMFTLIPNPIPLDFIAKSGEKNHGQTRLARWPWFPTTNCPNLLKWPSQPPGRRTFSEVNTATAST